MTVYYPYEEAEKVSLTTLESNVFTNSGAIRKNAENAVRRFCAMYHLSYSDVMKAIRKNYSFYWNEYKYNNPTASEIQILKAQKQAFKSSIYNRIAKEISKSILQDAQEWIWLPSSSDNPRDSHELRYVKTYTDTDYPDTLPAEEPNCKCGMKIIK